MIRPDPSPALWAFRRAQSELAEWLDQVRQQAEQRRAGDTRAALDDPDYAAAIEVYDKVNHGVYALSRLTTATNAAGPGAPVRDGQAVASSAGDGLVEPAAPAAGNEPADRRRLCAHADSDGDGMHWLDSGDQCQPVVDVEASAGTGVAELPDAVAPVWVDGYLTGHDRGMEEGRQAGYAEYDRQLVDGLAGMLAGDPGVTDYRQGVRRHEHAVDAKARRDAIRERDLLPDPAGAEPGTVNSGTGDSRTVDAHPAAHEETASDGLSAPAQAFIGGTTDAQRRVRQLVATADSDDDGWEC